MCVYSGHSAHSAEVVSARAIEQSATRSASIVTSEVPIVQVPQSEFLVDFNDHNGRDPFFPNAKYVKPTVAAPPKQESRPVTDDSSLSSLKLSGMGGVGEDRWAMINGTTIYLGEPARVQVNGKVLQLECVQMDEKSVTIGIVGTSIRRQLNLD